MGEEHAPFFRFRPVRAVSEVDVPGDRNGKGVEGPDKFVGGGAGVNGRVLDIRVVGGSESLNLYRIKRENPILEGVAPNHGNGTLILHELICLFAHEGEGFQEHSRVIA